MEIQSLSQGTLELLPVEAPASPLASTATTETSTSEAAASSIESPTGAPVSVAPQPRAPAASKGAHNSPVALLGFKVPRNAVLVAAASGLVLLAILVFGLRGGAKARPEARIAGGDTHRQSSEPAAPPAIAVERAAVPKNPTQQRQESALPSSAVTGSEAVNVEDTVRVAVKIRPEGSRVFYRGKEIGRTPFTLELLRDERRVFEVGYPGYQSRRLVIDGTEGEITYSLTPNN